MIVSAELGTLKTKASTSLSSRERRRSSLFHATDFISFGNNSPSQAPSCEELTLHFAGHPGSVGAAFQVWAVSTQVCFWQAQKHQESRG